MAKWHGKIGYSIPTNDDTGKWIDRIIELEYSGDVIKNTRRLQNGVGINDDIFISNQLSILSDPFAASNFYHMKYAEFMGTLWTVSDVEVQFPRLIISLGGIYNGEQA